MPTLKETEESLSYVLCFLYLVSSSINVSIFHITWLDTFWTDLYVKLDQSILEGYSTSELIDQASWKSEDLWLYGGQEYKK